MEFLSRHTKYNILNCLWLELDCFSGKFKCCVACISPCNIEVGCITLLRKSILSISKKIETVKDFSS